MESNVGVAQCSRCVIHGIEWLGGTVIVLISGRRRVRERVDSSRSALVVDRVIRLIDALPVHRIAHRLTHLRTTLRLANAFVGEDDSQITK